MQARRIRHSRFLPPLCSFVLYANKALQTSVELTARVCRSVLKTNVEEITFDNCVVGGTYVKAFTIENHSEMPLSFDITTHPVILTTPFVLYLALMSFA